MFDNLDLWDIKTDDNIKKYPKRLHNAVKMRLEQQKYVFGSEKTVLDKFRTLLNKSANDINPELFCNEIQKLFLLIENIKIIIKTPKQLRKEGLNLILSVDNLTSRMLIVEYVGNKSSKTNDLVIVGKGVTFDSGGYSIKKRESMYGMHLDKTGGVMALYLLHELAKKKYKKNIVVCVPLVQNNVSFSATKPGDIITSYSGIKVEITNTDAEGRLILADSISYCLEKYKPKIIIDMGTLTGIDQCKTSYSYYTLSNKLKLELNKVAKKYGENILELAIDKQYIKYTKSTRGDIKNAFFGCSDKMLVSLFLLNFIPKKYYYRWIHINLNDITIKKDLAILEGSYSIMDFIKKIQTT